MTLCGGRERLHILGMLDFTGNRALFQFSDTLAAKGLIALFRGLLREYPGERLHIVLDNAPAHHAKRVQNFVDQHSDQLELHFIPPYSPKLNPIEKFWKFLRTEVTHNTYFKDFDSFRQIIIEFLQIYKNPIKKLHDLCEIYHQTGPISVAAL